MSPRARRSESITLPPGNHPGLIRYKDEKFIGPEKQSGALEFEDTCDRSREDDDDESDLDSASEEGSYDNNNSTESSMLIEPTGR